MNKLQLFENIKQKKSFLCVGLDTDIEKIPEFLFDETDNPVLEFNRRIIDATADFCVAFKLNLAFYESIGLAGWEAVEDTVDYIRENYPNQFIIADAKRGDIGNTSEMYAKAFFLNNDFDAVTVSPYMGEDSIKPFLKFENKWAIVLALTSNKGAGDFQIMEENGEKLFERVLHVSQQWGNEDNLMYVVGATKAEMLDVVRKIVPNHFLLVPGVGAQGGSLQEVAKHGLNNECGLLVNSSRQIIYASSEPDFAEKARDEAQLLQKEMEEILKMNRMI